jgi:hypothetical protein
MFKLRLDVGYDAAVTYFYGVLGLWMCNRWHRMLHALGVRGVLICS